MSTLDHIILRVQDVAKSLAFYRHTLGFEYVGRVASFEIVRVSPSLTIDLMQEAPKDPVHLAFSFDRASFDALRARLAEKRIPIGGDVFVRDGQVSTNAFGARGKAAAFYFYDPDQHNLEARLYTGET